MATRINAKGQITIPKHVREAAGLKPGDRVDVRATPSGGVYVEKPGAARSYRERLLALAKQKLIPGITTDELMKELRGDPAEDPPLKPK
jgi:antitoxin PrlF